MGSKEYRTKQQTGFERKFMKEKGKTSLINGNLLRHGCWFPAKRQGRFFYTRRLDIEEKSPRVLWGPCPLWTGDTLSVLILRHVLDSNSFRYQGSRNQEILHLFVSPITVYTLIAILCNAVLTWLMLPWLMKKPTWKLFMMLKKIYIYNLDANMYYMHLISATLIMVLIIIPKGNVWEFLSFITCSHPFHHLVLSALEQNFGAWLLVKVSALMRRST